MALPPIADSDDSYNPHFLVLIGKKLGVPGTPYLIIDIAWGMG
jgi:hypothetical protein